jgi:hypothetical protein
MVNDTKQRIPQYLNGYYECRLPVHKQGDDLCVFLLEEDTSADAFEALARQYEEAAVVCRRMAAVARETPGLKVDADTHHIGVKGPVERLEAFVAEGLLQRTPVDEDDRAATEASFTEHLIDAFYDEKSFTVQAAARVVAEKDPELAGLNYVWVRETMDGMVEEGSLEKVGEDRYEVAEEDNA